MSIRKKFTKAHVEHFKNNKHLITTELLDTLRSQGDDGKLIALEILDTRTNAEQYHLDKYDNRISFDGNRQLKGRFVEMELEQIHLDELTKCYNDIFYFISNYAKIVTKTGVSFPETRKYQKDFLEFVTPDENEDLLLLSSRQSGKSVSIGLYLCHIVIFKRELNVGICANRASMAREFLDKLRKIYLELPMWMKVGTLSWNKSYVEFDNGIRVMTDATSGDSFRGFSCLRGDTNVEVEIKNIKQSITLEELYKAQSENMKILTPSGYQNFKGLRKTTNYGLNIVLSNGSIINCTYDHRVKVSKSIYRQAKNIKIGHKINNKVVVDILEDPSINDYYDPIDVDNGNCYVVDGITHHNCHIIVVDEAAFVKPSLYEDFSSSVFASQGALAFKKNIILSTANGMNHFYHMVDGARRGVNGYKIMEIDWREVPRYNSDGSVKDPDVFRNEIISKYGEVYFKSNYSNEFLGSSHTLISGNALENIKTIQPELMKDGILKIYHEPIKGHQYVMGVDPSMGIGGDYFGVQVLDITNLDMKQVASARLDMEYLKIPDYLHEWCQYYNNAYLIIENNLGSGQSISDMMVNTYEYENMHFDKSSDTNKRKKYSGFRTTTKTRKQILDNMKLFIENGKLEINDSDTYKEFFSFIYSKGKYQADDGAKDDMIMALAICFAPFCNMKNFEDMREITKLIFSEAKEDNNAMDLLSFGFFDSGVEERESDGSWTYEMPYAHQSDNDPFG